MTKIWAVLLVTCSIASAWTVCLDPGHGGASTGAVGTYYLEKNANLDVAFEAAFYLGLVPDCEWVGMTRTGDYDVSLQARCDYANQNGFDRFMSIHENAFNTTVQGSEVFCVLSSPGNDLASVVLDGILWAHGYTNRGVKDGSMFYVIANTNMDAILGEGTFIDYDVTWNESYRYMTNWNDHTGRQGWAYAAGICTHMGSTPPSYGPSGDVIVDNLSTGFSVNSETEWFTGSSGIPWDGDYRWSSAANQTDWAKWTPMLSESGWYEVYIWYTEGTNRAPDAVYTVHHPGGETEFTVDQTQGGNQWNLLGGFGFEAGSTVWVTLSEEGVSADRVVIADAVRFHPISTGIAEGSFTAMTGTVPELVVGPNPSSSFHISLTLARAQDVRIEVYDMSGRMMETISRGSMPQGETSFLWSPSGLPAAVYTILAFTSDGCTASRIVLIE